MTVGSTIARSTARLARGRESGDAVRARSRPPARDDRRERGAEVRRREADALEVRRVERTRRENERAADRKRQVGSGDRSERIRTYNYPQGRVTDHRIELTLYKLEEMLNGAALDEIIEPLIAQDQAERLAELN